MVLGALGNKSAIDLKKIDILLHLAEIASLNNFRYNKMALMGPQIDLTTRNLEARLHNSFVALLKVPSL